MPSRYVSRGPRLFVHPRGRVPRTWRVYAGQIGGGNFYLGLVMQDRPRSLSILEIADTPDFEPFDSPRFKNLEAAARYLYNPNRGD